MSRERAKISTGPSVTLSKKSGAKIATSEVQFARCSHLLIKHKDSRRPASWKDPNGDIIKERTKEQAIEKLTQLRQKIVAEEAGFGALASTESDCSSASKGGDLGVFRAGEMQKAFEDVAFSLEVGELSDIVQTDSGVHIILRTE